jgi:hypothetical protein
MEKPSYKNVILVEQPVETKQSTEIVHIDGYENIMNMLNEKKIQTNTNKRINNSKKELMIDVLNDMSSITGYVNEYYGCHGIGDELKLEDVMNILDKSVKVEVISDNDNDIESGEEE